MKKYLITFYVPGKDNELVFLAEAGAEGIDAHDAAPKARAVLEETYPEIQGGLWLACQVYSLEPETP